MRIERFGALSTYLREASACCSFNIVGQCQSLDKWSERQDTDPRAFFINRSAQIRRVYRAGCFIMKTKSMLLALMVGILGFLPQLGFAQGFKWEMSPKYVGELHAGYKTTTKVSGINLYTGMAELGTLQGVSLNQYLDLAVGVDALMLTHYYTDCGLRFAMATYFDMRPAYPINDRTKVFLDLGLGGYFNIKSDPDFGSGFFCQFGPGVKYGKANLSCGLQKFGTEKGSLGFFGKLGLYF